MYSAKGTGCCLTYRSGSPPPGRYIRLTLEILGAGSLRTAPTSTGAPAPSTADRMAASASGLRSGSMSEAFSGQTTRPGGRFAAATPRRVSCTWLSSTRRRSALKSRPGRGTLPCTNMTGTRRPSVGGEMTRAATAGASARAASAPTRPYAVRPVGGAAASAPWPADPPEQHHDRGMQEGPQRSHRRRHARGAGVGGQVRERAVGLAERQPGPREAAEGGVGARRLLQHPEDGHGGIRQRAQP